MKDDVKAVLFLAFIVAAVSGIGYMAWDIATMGSRFRAERLVKVEADRKRFESFLAQHGDTVTVIGMQDENKQVRSGKRYVTEGRVWRICKFPDDFTVEVEQQHDPVARVPLEGEKWRLKVVSNEWNSSIVFDDRVQAADQPPGE